MDRAGTGTDYATNTGSIWRIFYTGSNAPFISIHPQPVLIPLGENASFSVSVSGASPFNYQWQINGVDVPDANSPTFIFESPVLSDSGSLVRCIVTNALGADTSDAAVLNVTAGQRPVPELVSPAVNAFYRAGETLQLVAEATDAEDGTLPPSAFRWRIDFRHDDHSHPAFGPVSGIRMASFEIPQIGETSDNVWYRVTLTVTDQSGLSQTVVRDVLPLKSEIELQSEPTWFPMSIDSRKVVTPETVTSVVGIFHQIAAQKSHVANDSLYLFKQWSTGETTPDLMIAPPDEGLILKAIYEAVLPKGDGTGLQAYYYDLNETNFFFEEPYEFSRVDPSINFDWSHESPDVDALGDNGFFGEMGRSCDAIF